MLHRTLLDTREGLRKCVNPDFSLFFFVVILYFFLAALSLHWCTRAFSSCSEWRLLSSCGTWTLGRVGSIVVDHWLSCARHVESPRPGMEPVCPALAGRFLTPGPPGKP